MSAHDFVWWWLGLACGWWLCHFLSWLVGIWPPEPPVSERIRWCWRHKALYPPGEFGPREW